MLSRCVGFGEKSGKCENTAGTKWSPYWCEECNMERLDHISKRLKDLQEQFEAKQSQLKGGDKVACINGISSGGSM